MNCPGAEGTDLSGVKSGEVEDVNTIHLDGKGRVKEPPRNKQNSFGGEEWRVILRAGLFMFVCTSVNSISDDLCACKRRKACFFCLCRLETPEMNNYSIILCSVD